MRMCTGFWVGIGAGLMAGAAVGMMMPYGRDPMKTQVGKSIHKLGVAVTMPWTALFPKCADAQGGEPRLSAFFHENCFWGLTLEKALV